MNIKEIQEFNRKAIILACNPKAKNYEEALEMEFNLDDDICSVPLREYEGKPLTLDRVLIALSQEFYSITPIWFKGKVDLKINISPMRPLPRIDIIWTLDKATLQEQSEGTQQKVAKMLGWR